MADTLIFAELMIPKGGDLDIGKVLHQAIYGNGIFIGSHNENTLPNTTKGDIIIVILKA